MNRCKTCRWWGDKDIVDRDYVEECDDNYEIVTNAPEVRRCSCPSIVYKYDGDLAERYPTEGGAMYWDGSGYAAGFGTTATFGCACYEEREL